MSLTKFESEIKHLSNAQDVAYARFSDPRNLQFIRDALSNPALAANLPADVPADKLEEFKKYAESMTFDADSISIASPMGNIKLAIVEREVPKCIKFAGEGTPMPLYLWIQLLPETDGTSKMRVTIGAEVNMFMKAMVAKPLKQAADGLAQILAAAGSAPSL